MQKLTSLDHTLLTKSVIKTLAYNNITTVFEFLQQDAEKLSTLTKLNLCQILDIRNNIFTKYSAPLVDGLFLLSKSATKKRYIDIGIESLNVVLGGGIPVGYITELCGLAGSGKTQLGFQLVVNCVRETENTILFIDTKGDFDAVRIQKILDNLGCSHQEMARALFKIKIVQIWTMEELIELFKKLKNKSVNIENLAMIIIDSLPCLMFQHFGDDNKIGLTYMNIFVNYCRYLCKNHDIGVLCINIQTRWVEQDITDYIDGKDQTYVEKQNRCLGKYWQHIPAVIILIERLKLDKPINVRNDGFHVKATVVRSNEIKLEQHCILTVDSLGVR
ncbi:unnamed protein product [Parnassius mnemosyne]|uniref:RecA family profile 1 domain-containing protein n=1 Tax=Parnassius mnemosyne TaxID=213953 RepID=A0AAV1KGV6_9NEOP